MCGIVGFTGAAQAAPILQGGLAKLDLVTREEFEVQRAVLLRTREKLEALEQAVQWLEAELDGKAAQAGTTPAPPAH